MTVRRAFAAGTGLLLVAALGAVGRGQARAPQSPTAADAQADLEAVVTRYCVGCHNPRTTNGGIAFDTTSLRNVAAHPELWEKALRRLRARAMPPASAPRPDETVYQRLVADLERELDRAAAIRPNPGRTEPFRRLNRTEYQRAIRDLLDLDVDVAEMLPADDASFGFDNVSVAGLSPTLMERYLVAAQKISRLAVGATVHTPAARTVVLPADLTQEARLDGMPFGTRGGVGFEHVFPQDGDYTIAILLARDRNENVEGLTEPHEVEITLDGERLRVFTVTPNRNRLGSYYADEGVDKGLEVRVPVTAGPHRVAATFLAKHGALVETERQPYQAHFNMDRHPRTQPALRSVSIAGPFGAGGISETPSRRRIFVCREETDACARRIVGTLARRAYRRPVSDGDLAPLLGFYREAAAAGGGFDDGIEMALRATLASTEFLFRIERDPAGAGAGTAYRLDDVALASRLSFFLWSSPPDDQLLALAERGELRRPEVLEREVRRMLGDRRAAALSTNFAGQWLHLRNLAAARPDARLYPDFDDNLRQAFRRETELLFETILKENRSVTELLSAKFTFLNERLAKHYGVPNVYGDHFRRVGLDAQPERAGLLGHGSILTVTSYADRTSPVLRGKWILENMLGMPPPPPPQNVPPLGDAKRSGKTLSMRERMLAHRGNPTCASCHQLMDPAGLSMENFDAIGRWRTRGDDGTAIDASGSLPGSAAFDGVGGLRQTLTARPEVFVTTMTEKLLTFALGRGIDYSDAPAIRQIVRDASRDDYRFTSVILAMTRSAPFTMRRAE
jgi:hypothetical protein